MTLFNYLLPILLCILIILLLQKRRKLNKVRKQKATEEALYQNYIKKFHKVTAEQKLPLEYTNIVGTRYKNEDGTERQDLIKKAKIGDRLLLLPDELNPHDKDAVKVIRLNGDQLGFIDMDQSLELKSRMLSGSRVDARIEEIKQVKGTLNVKISLQKYSRKQQVKSK
ncbi:HIRAN domain-containing protein [Limibacter armeniacum]|uniref:HIRAN domain-containing protein n=1 Tax=Limibacter armeniacum TaxID=466084 RepID=UPI002FE5ADD9